MTTRSRVAATARFLALGGLALLVTVTPVAGDVPPDDPAFIPMNVIDHWSADQIPVRVKAWINGMIPDDAILEGRLDLDQAVAGAAAAWSDVPGSVLSFDYIGWGGRLAPDAVNVYFDARDDSFALAITDLLYNYEVDPSVPRDQWRLLSADIVLDPDFPWTTSDSPPWGVFDLQTVLTHELGYVLGLAPAYLTDPGTGLIIYGANSGDQVMEPRYEGVRRELSPLDTAMLLAERVAPPATSPTPQSVMGWADLDFGIDGGSLEAHDNMLYEGVATPLARPSWAVELQDANGDRPLGTWTASPIDAEGREDFRLELSFPAGDAGGIGPTFDFSVFLSSLKWRDMLPREVVLGPGGKVQLHVEVTRTYVPGPGLPGETVVLEYDVLADVEHTVSWPNSWKIHPFELTLDTETPTDPETYYIEDIVITGLTLRAVPEPATVTVMLAGMLVALRRRRRR